MAYNLNEREAFEAMTLFLGEFYKRTSGDMATLLTDLQMESDGMTLDPAAWDDWLRCVASVKDKD